MSSPTCTLVTSVMLFRVCIELHESESNRLAMSERMSVDAAMYKAMALQPAVQDAKQEERGKKEEEEKQSTKKKWNLLLLLLVL